MTSLCAIYGSDWGREAGGEGSSMGYAAGIEKEGVGWRRRVATKSMGRPQRSPLPNVHTHRGEGGSIASCDDSRGKRPEQVSTVWFLSPLPLLSPSPDSVQLWDARWVFEEDGPDIPGLSELPSLCVNMFLHCGYCPHLPSLL